MGILDIVLGLLLAYGFYRGLRNGLFIEIASLVALIAGLYGAIHLSYITGDYLEQRVEWDENYVSIVAFIITFFAIVLLIHLAGKIQVAAQGCDLNVHGTGQSLWTLTAASDFAVGLASVDRDDFMTAFDTGVPRDVSSARNRDVSGGELDSGKRRYLLRTVGRFDSVESLEDLIIDRRGDSLIRLRDVAVVELDHSDPLELPGDGAPERRGQRPQQDRARFHPG